MSQNVLKSRLEALRSRLEQLNLDGCLITCPENRRYLSGFTARDEFPESSGLLLICRDYQWLLTDFRYLEWARSEARDFEVAVYHGPVGATVAGLLAGRPETRRLGFEASYLTYRGHQSLLKAFAEAGVKARWLPQEGMVEPLRAVKHPEEVEAMRRALALTETVLETVAAGLAPGVTEAEVAWEIERRFKELGAQGPAFAPIVAAGPNSARPHHQPGDYRLQEGEPIIIDLGARVAGYCADLTRTYILGPPDEHFQKIYRLVRWAQARAEAEIRAGMNSRAADALAREVIAGAGYGEAFGHSLGHGVGLAVHEAPALSPLKERTGELKAGSIVTIEPGIYLTGWGGVRLEDMALIHEDRCEVLTKTGFYEW